MIKLLDAIYMNELDKYHDGFNEVVEAIKKNISCLELNDILKNEYSFRMEFNQGRFYFDVYYHNYTLVGKIFFKTINDKETENE